MGVNSLPKTVTRQRRGCNLNTGPSAPESSTLTTRLPSHLTTTTHIISHIVALLGASLALGKNKETRLDTFEMKGLRKILRVSRTATKPNEWVLNKAGARFTKYLTTILRLSYDNAKVTINLRRMSNLQNILQ